ncbi:zinc-binding dehydrogenase family oxidoreductase [Zopfochytrium polystomum]|nr:zinc-binding dehydrogenase family oxidoreductase [Zopfochytrium polystomum]
MEQVTVIFKSEPKGFVDTTDLEVVKEPYHPNQLADGDVLLKPLYISLDPYMRGRMRVGVASYTASFELGKPMAGGVVAEVIESANAAFPVGTVAVGLLPWKKYIVHANPEKTLLKIDTSLGVPLSYYLGVLGMPGMTAYAGLIKFGKPKEGETLYVSAAAGAVGLVVCQIGKALGLKVVGSAGSDDKVEFLKKEAKIDEAFNYKTETDFNAALKKYCPQGIDIYFENVGGEMLDAVFLNMNNYGRIPVCGMISQYNGQGYALKNSSSIVTKRLQLSGFIVGDHSDIKAEFVTKVGGWIKTGQIVYSEHVVEGMENIPAAFVGLFKGENKGKLIIKV